MKTKLRHLKGKLLASYWFVPSVMCAVSAVAAWGALSFDREADPATRAAWKSWVEVNTADGARSLLSTIASSTITLAGVVFSITILTISFASTNYGPRLLRNFMRDRPSQWVLGTFASSYVYSLFVLRTVGSDVSAEQVPHLAIAGAFVLAIITVAVLIFFIHHIARAIQASSVIASVGRDLDALTQEFTTQAHPAPRPAAPAPERSPKPIEIRSVQPGYIQALAREDLVELAQEAGGWIEMQVAPGDQVTAGALLANIHPASPAPPTRFEHPLRAAIVIGQQRTNEQDLEFPIDQLAEIAIRALSPSLNDPFTAIDCINRLGGSLRRLAAVTWPSPHLLDDEGGLRVKLLSLDFDRLLHRAFDQVLHFGGDNPVIVRQVLKVLAQINAGAVEPHRAALLAFADRAWERVEAKNWTESYPGLREIRQASQERREPRARPDV